MPMQQISFGYTANPSRNDTQAIPINCYAENMGEQNESRWVHYACAGYSSFSTLPFADAAFRGMLAFDDTKLFVASGVGVYRVTTDGAQLGMLVLPGTAYAYMARNRKEPNAQVAIVTTDGEYWIIENDAGSEPTIDPDVGASEFNSVCGMDGYFIFTKASGEWYISAIDEGTSIDDLRFALANTKPDGLVRGITRGRDVILMGSQSCEVWQNTGQTDFAFERVTSIGIGVAYGPAAVNCTAVTDGGTADVVIFPANNPDGSYLGVVMLDGYNAKTISPFALDRAIQAEPTKSSIMAFSYAENGHTFYVIRGSTFSWSYDCTTGFWHLRQASDGSVWPIAGACTLNGRQVFAPASTGVLYRMDQTPTAPGSASTIALYHSNDNGLTFTGPRSRNVGTEKTKRVRWVSLGESREDGKVMKFVFSNALVENGTGVPMQIITPPVHAFPNRMIFNAVYCNITAGVSQTANHKGFVTLAIDADVKVP